MKKHFPMYALITAILVAGLSQLDAGMTTVTVHNYTSTALTIQDLNGGHIGDAPGGSPSANSRSTFVLDDTHTFNLGQYFQQLEGHQFNFVGGQVNPLGVAAETEFFEANGNDIYVSGVELRWKMVSGTASQSICGNAGCFNFFGIAFNGGSDAVFYVPPADTNFNGKYDSIQFFSPSANLVNLRLGTNFGIADFSGTGASFTPIDQFSILATISNGNQFIISAIPEPSTLGLVMFVTLACLGVRSKRRP